MSRRIRDYFTRLLWVAILVAIVAPPPAMAQELRGQIVGVAKDSSGGTLPGVLVTVTGPAIIRPQTATTDIDGSYRFPALPPGDYVVTFELSQFQTVRREGIQLTLQTILKIDATLAPASVSAEVNVVATAPVVDVLRHPLI